MEISLLVIAALIGFLAFVATIAICCFYSRYVSTHGNKSLHIAIQSLPLKISICKTRFLSLYCAETTKTSVTEILGKYPYLSKSPKSWLNIFCGGQILNPDKIHIYSLSYTVLKPQSLFFSLRNLKGNFIRK